MQGVLKCIKKRSIVLCTTVDKRVFAAMGYRRVSNSFRSCMRGHFPAAYVACRRVFCCYTAGLHPPAEVEDEADSEGDGRRDLCEAEGR